MPDKPNIKPIKKPPLPQVDPVEKGTIVKKERRALLVAGVNYPRYQQGNKIIGRTYFKFALNYKDYLLKKNLVDRVDILDFFTGKILLFRKGASNKGQLIRPLLKPLIKKNYRYHVNDVLTVKPSKQFRRRLYYTGIDEYAKQNYGDPDADVPKEEYDKLQETNEKTMSILHLYELIRYSRAQTIREVHFMGHAWLGGPIIVNTPGYTSKIFDKDGRSRDFTNHKLKHVFDSQNLPYFIDAFADDPIITVWGCEDNKPMKTVITIAQAKFKQGKSITQELNQLKAVLATTYAANLAKRIKKNVYAALPGTYAVHEGEPNDDPSIYNTRFQPKVMHVNFKECEHLLRFYKKHLNIKFPTTGAFKGHPDFGRGYAIYEP